MAGMRDPAAALDCYVRVEQPRAAQAAILENEVRITTPGKTRNYISYATALLSEKKHTTVALKAMGQAINKTVTIAEIIKRRIPGLHQETVLQSLEIKDTWEPLEEGLSTITFTRHVSVVSITLSRLPLNISKPGYQAPLPPDQVKPLLPPSRTHPGNDPVPRSVGAAGLGDESERGVENGNLDRTGRSNSGGSGNGGLESGSSGGTAHNNTSNSISRDGSLQLSQQQEQHQNPQQHSQQHFQQHSQQHAQQQMNEIGNMYPAAPRSTNVGYGGSQGGYGPSHSVQPAPYGGGSAANGLGIEQYGMGPGPGYLMYYDGRMAPPIPAHMLRQHQQMYPHQGQMHPGQYQRAQQLMFQQQQQQQQHQQQQQQQQGGSNWAPPRMAGRGRGRTSNWQQGGITPSGYGVGSGTALHLQDYE